MKKRPIHPEKLQDRVKRFKNPHPMMFSIPALFTLECEIVLHAYYGSKWKAGWHMVWRSVVESTTGVYWYLIWSFSDWVGWTKLVPIPECGPLKQRHGIQCNDADCAVDEDCIRRAIPRWFSVITGMERHNL